MGSPLDDRTNYRTMSGALDSSRLIAPRDPFTCEVTQVASSLVRRWPERDLLTRSYAPQAATARGACGVKRPHERRAEISAPA